MKSIQDILAAEPPHPLLPLPGLPEVQNVLAQPGGVKTLGELLAWRRNRIQAANDDPLYHELEPPDWADARQLLVDRVRVIIILGGNRSAKSRFCGKVTVEALARHPGTTILCVSEDETASRETQQAIIWHYLPAELKAMRGRRDPAGIWYINYSVANGFSERRLVLPNRSKLLFATYGEDPDQYEGMMWGHPVEWTVGWWADENLRLSWLKMLRRRGRFQPGSGLWSFTPIKGITPAIKECLGETPETLAYRPALLLPDRINVPGLPVGTMPYIQRPFAEGARVIYFHTERSPFGPGPNGSGKRFFESVKEDCAGRPSEYIMRIAYGYTRDVAGRAFPLFGPVHVVRPESVPDEGTNYHFVDPAGRRNWFNLWVRVVSGQPSRLFVYRDWPDEQSFGEWAVPTERATTADSRKGWDGDPGPAQGGQGFGIIGWKKLWRSLEGKERVWERYIDPRAGRNALAAEKGGTCLVDQFAAEHAPGHHNFHLPEGQVAPAGGAGEPLPPYHFIPASGVDIEEGIMAINNLLAWDPAEPFDLVMNSPRLFVSSACRQVIWALANYTGLGGETGGCKDVVDCLRYMALADLYYRDPKRPAKRAGGSY